MVRHDRVVWFTNPNQITQMDDFILPIITDLHGRNDVKFKELTVIIRIENNDEHKSSLRYLYGILFAVYQRITILSSRIDPIFTANLDLRVYLEHLCDIKLVTNNFSASSISFIIYDDSSSDSVQKPNVTFIKIKRDPERIFVPESPLLFSIPDEESYKSVALGGTFDHLHSGHKLMLSLASLISRDRILCGITASEMLSSKNHPEKLEPLDDRMFAVQEFLVEFKAKCEKSIEIVTLRDPFGPTIELDDLDALVVSPETLPGGLKINNIRKDKRLALLDIIQVDFIIADSKDPDIKLSSTFIRSHIDNK